jgi:hypothetical protein
VAILDLAVDLVVDHGAGPKAAGYLDSWVPSENDAPSIDLATGGING